ncbi:uncharacterized protein LOC105690202 isoform X1 [Athalia rosae]|uniref:uncharacterized protein LOC105690202 isoform X1 n=1 Tax=Athalia rosae TaxID=37344 RepID=UPI000A0EE697|nr:uncharacterized protein LOC105690202 isoform X1 [Athalia rosae]XP_048512240.1 uncharacterized protein LOC105690202 isoform X1 [Athalia rosae]XP_048512241.1 uncharacterized protein LOC105690202 isoform X1 [Athalia rosae]
MRSSRVIFVTMAALCAAAVQALPVEQPESLVPAGQDLDRLMIVEADDQAALRSKRTIGILRQLFPGLSQDVNPEAENQVVAESQNNEVRVQFADEQGDAAPAGDLTPLDDVELSDENRNKRFLNGDSLSGGGGGSGNFIFDLIRQTADGAARAAGTVYRVVAGTQSLGLGLSASRDIAPIPAAPAPMGTGVPAPPAPPAPGPGSSAAPAGNPNAGPGLIAGSGSSEAADVAANSPVDSGKGNDGSQEAVPGPVTRLFVIANRGISNLIQDLILRLAATSERIVNFKARLITSII